jgi:hypothetical protein
MLHFTNIGPEDLCWQLARRLINDLNRHEAF